MVRHDNGQQGIYDRARNYAMPTVLERLEDVTSTKVIKSAFFLSHLAQNPFLANQLNPTTYGMMYTVVALPLTHFTLF